MYTNHAGTLGAPHSGRVQANFGIGCYVGFKWTVTAILITQIAIVVKSARRLAIFLRQPEKTNHLCIFQCDA